MPFLVKSRHTTRPSLEKNFPGAEIIDVTSKAPEPWVKFSPFYPHKDIPIPFSPNMFGVSVEGIWQGLKVFEREGIDRAKMQISDMKGIKRGGKSRGRVLGHQRGLQDSALLSYLEARQQIYVPTYRWILENRLTALVAQLLELGSQRQVVLLDYETNCDINDLSKPLSHAGLIVKHLDGEQF